MRLAELNPRWFVLEDGGPRVGLTFECPHCRTQRLGVVFHHGASAAIEDQYILARLGADGTRHIWDLSGQDNFETLTLSPSVDCSASGHWHGHVQNGEIR